MNKAKWRVAIIIRIPVDHKSIAWVYSKAAAQAAPFPKRGQERVSKQIRKLEGAILPDS